MREFDARVDDDCEFSSGNLGIFDLLHESAVASVDEVETGTLEGGVAVAGVVERGTGLDGISDLQFAFQFMAVGDVSEIGNGVDDGIILLFGENADGIEDLEFGLHGQGEGQQECEI